MKKMIAICTFSMLLSACVYNQKPVVDMTNVNAEQYEKDFDYCQSYSEKVNKEEAATTEAKNGALSGSLLGAVAGGLEDGIGGAAVGAIAGGAIGGGIGAATGANESTKVQSKVLRRCLVTKGYTVYDLD